MDSTDKGTLGTAQLAGALDNLPVGITLIDPAGHILYLSLFFFNQRPPFDNPRAEFPGDIIHGLIRFFPFSIGPAAV